MLAGEAGFSTNFVTHGYFPCSPHGTTVVITARVLELYRITRLRCPRLAIQPFVKSLCDLHGAPFRPYLSTQFSVAFDVYLATLAIVDARVKALLRRDAPDWRLKNACPACMYKLEDEPPLLLPFLSTKDGNNSLKRWDRRERGEDGAAGESKERADSRKVPGDYYLSRDEVDLWGQEELEELMKGFTPDPEDDGCSDRWANMKEQVTSKAWGMYEETGVFLSLCRHGFVLLIADMVRSGELAKYGFAVTNHLIKALGEIAEGYDIGCKAGKMVNAHPVLGKLARENNYRSLVGAFHGHGHCRLCQLSNLATYVEGVGLEDLEYCETFFSRSNALASSTRYASRFHRQQAIATFLGHTDGFETYPNLSGLLCNKYKRALEVLRTEPALEQAMRDLGVQTKDTFVEWLAREKECLLSLKREPLEETLAMEYYQKLVNLDAQTTRMNNTLAIPAPPLSSDPTQADYEADARATRRLEAQRRHAIELHNKLLLAVQDLEIRMDVAERWVPGSEAWREAATLVQRRRYQRAIDELQGLIIARMFELTKMNMSGTGYKLRKHIAKALQARSRAVKTALENYNSAGAALRPPRPPLTWEQVVDYAFLSDFDLLHEGREDIREETWAKPAGRLAMDMHFKIQRAQEEIIRLNIEVRRLWTYMQDEEGFLWREEGRIRREHGEALAYQVRRLRLWQEQFNSVHRSRLTKLKHTAGFTGTLERGTPINQERLAAAGSESAVPQESSTSTPPPDSDSDDSDDEAEALAEHWALLRVTEDGAGAHAEPEVVIQGA
ncbi:hypothetical protein B0H15DRAFT_791447 [Mycena belliarum]|uniref:CxC1-like cysteine cluster associated with KDZ transposases domain-containing protein n=1 Tax=Mycena belliarum TaxID=1033014 RepID=A0AAD6TRP4_9AGAR|nr:hypothetical protein B0H15DRAFT_791447 [Mycena belliae]